MIRPAIEVYSDYRLYLQRMIRYMRALDRRFSVRNFSKAAGFASPSMLGLVTSGKRNLSIESIARFANAFRLSQRETEIFELLVLLNQSNTPEQTQHYSERLREKTAASRDNTRRLQHARLRVYSLWYALPIRELMLLPNFQEDPHWIAAQLRPGIRPSEAQAALELLEECGLVSRNDDGRLEPRENRLATDPQVQSLAVRSFHREVLHSASQALDAVPMEERNMTSLLVTINPAQYAEVVERTARFRRELMLYLDQAAPDGGGKAVHVMAINLFPVSVPARPTAIPDGPEAPL